MFPLPFLDNLLLYQLSDAHIWLQALSCVGNKWRAVCTYLNIPQETMQKQLQSHFGNINKTLFRLLCMWCTGKGTIWGELLHAFRTAELNAQANRLQEWIESGPASASCVVMWGVASRGIQQ